MNRIRSGDAEIAYAAFGDGPPVVLLHPFPADHEFWLPASQFLESRYRILVPTCAHTSRKPAKARPPWTNMLYDLARPRRCTRGARYLCRGIDRRLPFYLSSGDVFAIALRDWRCAARARRPIRRKRATLAGKPPTGCLSAARNGSPISCFRNSSARARRGAA